MRLLEKTPRELVQRLIEQKGNLDGQSTSQPSFIREQKWDVSGSGDWSMTRSSLGSRVFTSRDLAVKIPQGTTNRNALEWAKHEKALVGAYGDVSPETMIIIANNGVDAVPVIIQKKVEGRPICDLPLMRLITRPKIWKDTEKILDRTEDVLKEFNCMDLNGLKWRNPNMSKLTGMFPFLTDNIMIDNKDNAWLTDNTPDVSHEIHGINKKRLQLVRLQVSKVFCRGMEIVATVIEAGARFFRRR